MMALKENCDCEPCRMLRDVADSLIAQLRAASPQPSPQRGKKADSGETIYKAAASR